VSDGPGDLDRRRRPVDTPRVVRPIADDELEAALAIVDEGIGPGWTALDDLRPAPGVRVVVAELDGRVAGVATARLRETATLLERAHPDTSVALRAEIGPAMPTVVVLNLAVVAPPSRGRGIYRALLDDRVSWGRREGAGLAVALGWAPPDGCHIAPAMARAGFTALAEIPGVYRADSVAAGAVCPACGPPPCDCPGVFFSRWVAPA
jgi:GNAT superfamily N-acetyltransferase